MLLTVKSSSMMLLVFLQLP